MEKETYASAGVNVTQAERFVERLKGISRRQQHGQLWPAAGGYAAVYPVSESKGIAVTTDGVGTKLLVAQKLNKHDTIGVDLVAMCANDLICVGAKPSIFLDYFATGALQDTVADDIIAGIVKGCDQAGMLLVGGETAEMPGVYEPGHYDLAGFAVGEVDKEHLLTAEGIAPGQSVIGIASNGIHSNGLSLARKVLADNEKTWRQLLLPTLVYAKAIVKLLSQPHHGIKGIAHITGGGWRNIFRLNDKVGYHIDNPLPVPEILQQIGKHVAQQEMYSTFNMGMGLCLVVDSQPQHVLELLKADGFTAQIVGTVNDRRQRLTLEGTSITLEG